MIDLEYKYLPQFAKMWTTEWRECYSHGGRGTGKSYDVAFYVLIQSLIKKNEKFLICRETARSHEDSAYENIVSKIRDLGIESQFSILKESIKCLQTGTKIIFSGMLPHHIGAIKSKENITLCWIEEAQYICQISLDVLIPTIIRNKGIKIIYTINPRYATDAVYQRFNGEHIPKHSLIIKSTIEGNPHFSDGMKDERELAYKVSPEMARHIWEGELMPSGNESAVLPLHWLKKCVDAHKTVKKRFAFNNYFYAGLDPATGVGKDKSAISICNESLILEVHEYDVESKVLVDKVIEMSDKYDIERLFYDGVGIGHNMGELINSYHSDRDYSVSSIIGSSSPLGKDLKYNDKYTNGEFFKNLKAQIWWHLRIRLEKTIQFLDGEDIDYRDCLFFSSNIKDLDGLLLELSQASYYHDDSKLKVDKQPNDSPSPNRADAVGYSMFRYMSYGLKSK